MPLAQNEIWPYLGHFLAELANFLHGGPYPYGLLVEISIATRFHQNSPILGDKSCIFAIFRPIEHNFGLDRLVDGLVSRYLDGLDLDKFLCHSESLNIGKISKINFILLQRQLIADFKTYFKGSLCLV